MEANVYFFAALVSTGIFLLQFILSIFFGSMDTDIDVNAVSIRPRACFSPSYNKVKSQTKHVWLLTLL